MAMNRCFGRSPHSYAAFAAAPSHRFGAARPPTTVDRSAVAFTPIMGDNDQYSDCTAVAIANVARGIAALNGYQLVVEDGKPLAFYGECLGNPPDLKATDGAVFQDVLNDMSARGYDIGPQRLAGRYGTVDPASETAIANAIARLGPIPLGVRLYDRDMQANASGGAWDVLPGRDDGPLVGRHELFAWDYTSLAGTLRLGTWAEWQACTWPWLLSRLDEAHGLVFRQLVRADGTFYDGLNADDLVAELD